jgi:putative glutamine amidotransferase
MRRLANAFFSPEGTFKSLFPEQSRVITPEDFLDEDFDALVIWGGEDISPSIYGETPSTYTHAPSTLSHRDNCEVTLAKLAIEMSIPIIGICRGAQLMCALSGGKVIQHVTGHAGRGHQIQTSTGQVLWTNSLHHQMMLPTNVEYTLLAHAAPSRSNRYIGADNAPITLPPAFQEPEVIWIPATQSLCIQGHPEFNDATEQFIRYCEDLVDTYICQPT